MCDLITPCAHAQEGLKIVSQRGVGNIEICLKLGLRVASLIIQ